jgi:hypothetical protein
MKKEFATQEWGVREGITRLAAWSAATPKKRRLLTGASVDRDLEIEVTAARISS